MYNVLRKHGDGNWLFSNVNNANHLPMFKGHDVLLSWKGQQ